MNQALRGGSFWFYRGNMRCSGRYGDKPGLQFDINGFRVAKHTGSIPVLRGGSWANLIALCCTDRNYFKGTLDQTSNDLGFRIARRTK